MTREGGILPVLNALMFGLKEYYAFLCIMFLQASFINTDKGKKEKKKVDVQKPEDQNCFEYIFSAQSESHSHCKATIN